MKRLQLYLIPALVLALCLIGAFWFAPYLAGRRVLVTAGPTAFRRPPPGRGIISQ